MKKLVIVLAFLALIACAQKPAAEHPADVTVTIKDFKFSPETITVKVGQTIKWVNEDQPIHTVTAMNKAFSSPELYTGDSFTYTATKQGNYAYACSIHPTMKGNVIVE